MNLTVLVPGGLRKISPGCAVSWYGSRSGRVLGLCPGFARRLAVAKKPL